MTNYKNQTKRQKGLTAGRRGFAQIILIIVLLIGIVALSAFSFYYLKFNGGLGKSTTNIYEGGQTPTPVAKTEVGNISEKTDTKTLQTELDATNLDSIDADLNDLNTSAGGL